MKFFFQNSIFFTIWLIILSCNFQKQSSSESIANKSPIIQTIFLSSDTRGSLEPCGCKSGQMGGLPRQAQYFMQNRQEGDLLLDAGNSISPQITAYEIFKWYYVLLTYEKMGYDAVNLGQLEVQLPASQIHSLRQKVPVPLVSANAVDPSGQPLAIPYIIKKNNSAKIAISGVVSSTAKTGEGVRVLSPIESLAKYLPDMIKESQMIIVLGNLTEEESNTLAEEFPEIGMILNTGTQTSATPRKIGPVVLSTLTELGRYVQKLNFNFNENNELSWLKAENVRLGNNISDHPGTVYLLNRYRQELSEKRFYVEQQQQLPKGEKYVGSERCSLCHNQIFENWKNTAHSHSLDSLKRKKNEFDPHCLKCHVTGLGIVSGYKDESETPNMAKIGCEVCHGPSYRHSYHDNIQQLRPSPSNPNPRESCLECHTWEHCDNFDFKTFWPKIAHSKN